MGPRTARGTLGSVEIQTLKTRAMALRGALAATLATEAITHLIPTAHLGETLTRRTPRADIEGHRMTTPWALELALALTELALALTELASNLAQTTITRLTQTPMVLAITTTASQATLPPASCSRRSAVSSRTKVFRRRELLSEMQLAETTITSIKC